MPKPRPSVASQSAAAGKPCGLLPKYSPDAVPKARLMAWTMGRDYSEAASTAADPQELNTPAADFVVGAERNERSE